ncbi:S8 family serine peptidase [Streptomyces sp. NPDC051569]|uniref:S8 family serine peptidase n=1 Tax=Streptomyces sp. NPDC051569 TaxID=3365661 RepID=UPI003797761B
MPLFSMRRPGLIALGTAVAVLTATPSVPAVAGPAPAGPASTPAATRGADRSTPRTVTLITGDKVTVVAGTFSVRGSNGGNVGARIATVGSDTYVYPDAAMPYIAAGLLDDNLFNVTRLLAYGYDDAHSDRLPLIVTYTDAATSARKPAAPAGAAKVRALSSIQGAALTADHGRAADFWSSLTKGAVIAGNGTVAAGGASRTAGAGSALGGGIAKVWLDGKVKAAMADTTAQIGAPAVWKKGNTGVGVAVAVLDTGVDAAHPDLAGQISSATSFVPGEPVTDRHGHGTHVASTIAGTGAASDGAERGVAPGASLRIGKVLSDEGEGQDSWILAGMEWAARDQHAKVISMSLGGAPSDGTDPLSLGVNALSAETGALFAIAAGNAGPDMMSVGAPGSADAALTVGAVDTSDRIAVFSSRGPRVGDHGLKPEITAPGVDVKAARSQYSAEGSGPYLTMSGTSMATPHVAGVAALLSATHPDWTGQQLKDALLSSSKPTPQYSPYWAGSGRVNALAAVEDTLFATGTAFSSAKWPYSKGQLAEKPVTYTNTGDTPVTLDLAVNAPGVPEGVFTLSTKQITVPARSTATVRVTTDLAAVPDEGAFAGHVNATGPDGGLRAHTLVGVNKEGERASFSVRTKDRAGKPLAGTLVVKDILRDSPPQAYEVTSSGSLKLSIKPSTYDIRLYAEVRGAHGAHTLGMAVFAAPETVVGTGSSLTLDGTKLRQVEAVTPQATSVAGSRVDYFRSYADRYPYDESQLVDSRYDSIWTQPTKKVTKGSFTMSVRWRRVQPPLTVRAGALPLNDLLVQTASKSLPTGTQKLTGVFAGEGKPADLTKAKVRGKVAVVRANKAITPLKQADAAVKAGAKLLLIVNNGYGRMDAWATAEGATPPLPVASLPADHGNLLISRIRGGSTRLDITSHRTPDYLYDLVRHFQGAVPTNLVYKPGVKDLAKVDTSFRHHRKGQAMQGRYDIAPGRTWAMDARPVEVPAQGRMTEWVTAGKDVRWIEMGFTIGITEASTPVTYAARTTTKVNWFAPVQRPRMFKTDFTSPPVRTMDELFTFNLPAWGDSGKHWGLSFDQGATQLASVYQGKTLLASSTDGNLYAPLPQGKLPYRLVMEAARPAAVSPYSSKTRTEWGFTSSTTKAEQLLPLIQLDYGISTDLAGKAARNADLTVSAVYPSGGPRSDTIRTATVEVSYNDGKTWSKASTKHTGSSWKTRLKAPAKVSYVTLRVTARDTQGNSVVQTINRAFGLR